MAKLAALNVIVRTAKIITKVNSNKSDYVIKDSNRVVNAQKVSVRRIIVSVSRKDKAALKSVSVQTVTINLD